MNDKKLIAEYLPDIKVMNVKVLTHGYDNDIIEVNNDYILRIRKVELEIGPKVEREMLLLVGQYVGLSTPLPLPQSTDECLVYKKIPGGLLSQSLLKSVKDQQIHTRADQLSRFFVDLHTRELFDKMSVYNIPFYNKADIFLSKIEQSDFYKDEIHKKYCEALISLKRNITIHQDHITFLHNDIYPNNIIIDPDTLDITGIIDFTDCTFGNPHIDFMFLYFEDISLAKKTIEHYNAISQYRIDETIVFFYASIFAALEYKGGSDSNAMAEYWINNNLLPSV